MRGPQALSEGYMDPLEDDDEYIRLNDNMQRVYELQNELNILAEQWEGRELSEEDYLNRRAEILQHWKVLVSP
jgi:hypothetical protein